MARFCPVCTREVEEYSDRLLDAIVFCCPKNLSPSRVCKPFKSGPSWSAKRLSRNHQFVGQIPSTISLSGMNAVRARECALTLVAVGKQGLPPLNGCDIMRGAVDCAEYKRLVAEHLRTIAEWKRTFDSPEAWEKAMKAERAVAEHGEEHGCQEASKSSRVVQT